jgi:hypothetical protein
MPGIVDSHHLAAGAGEDRAALSGHPRKANAGQYEGVMPQPDPLPTRDASTRSLAASAGEDRAALSGRPRKANAGQYAGLMPPLRPVRRRNATTATNTTA